MSRNMCMRTLTSLRVYSTDGGAREILSDWRLASTAQREPHRGWEEWVRVFVNY